MKHVFSNKSIYTVHHSPEVWRDVEPTIECTCTAKWHIMAAFCHSYEE